MKAASNLCESCERNRQLREGLCSSCIRQGLKEAQADEDPNLERYRVLVSRAVKVSVGLSKAAQAG